MRCFGILWILFFFPIYAEILVAPEERYVLKDWTLFRGHQGFYPYLCELSYRTLANHVIDPTHREFDPERVRPGDIIYLGVWYLDWFIEKVHDRISVPYILITCDVGGYLPHPSHSKLLFDPKLAYWFAKNMLFTNHHKLFQLPMGQLYYLWADAIAPSIYRLEELVKTPFPKEILLYLNHTERNHGRRIRVADKFWNQPYCLSRNRPRQCLSFQDFWNEIARSKFVLSPLGLEVDCTRTWECFVLGAIPVVEHSYLDSLYEDLPILLIYDWDEINEQFLHKMYAEIWAKPYRLEKAYFDYWAKLIREKQNVIRSGHRHPSTMEANNFSDGDIALFKKILKQHDKLKTPLIFRGNLTSLRPFQIAKAIESLPFVGISDLWTYHGHSDMRQFCANRKLLKNSDVQVLKPSAENSRRQRASYFLDLTHFRHSLYLNISELDNFQHSLEKSIVEIHSTLRKGDLLFGNMASDAYVAKVIERLKNHHHFNIKIDENFWHLNKNR